MRVLLTGATGFVGRGTARQLVERGFSLRLLVRDPGRLEEDLGRNSAVEIVAGSLEMPPAGLGFGVDAVVHVAGLVDARRTRDYHRVNVEGSRRLASRVAEEAPELPWVQVSSLAATGPADPARDDDPPRPVSRYGASKLAGERAVAEAGFPQRAVVRPPAVYGPGDRAFLPFFRDVARGRPVLLPRGGPARLSFVHVGDLARALIAVLEAPPEQVEGRVFHAAGPEQPSLDEFLALVGEVVGRRPRALRLPSLLGWAAAACALPLRLATGKPAYLSLDKMRELTAPAWCCDAAGLRRQTDWEPGFSLPAGLADTAQSYRAAGFLA